GRRVLDASVRVEEEQLAGLPGGEVEEQLGAQRVEPAQPVRPGDGDDAEVREVDDAAALLERALLLGGLSVVEGDAGVGAAGRDGAGTGEQRAGHAPASCRLNRPEA